MSTPPSGRWSRLPRRRKAGIAVLAAVGVALTALAVNAADGDGLIYYRTPTEAVRTADEAGPVRIGGMVVPGSVTESEDGSQLLLTDGATDVRVHYTGRFPDVLREGQGAVVEGRWTVAGEFVGEELLLRHSNEYRAPEAAQ